MKERTRKAFALMLILTMIFTGCAKIETPKVPSESSATVPAEEAPAEAAEAVDAAPEEAEAAEEAPAEEKEPEEPGEKATLVTICGGSYAWTVRKLNLKDANVNSPADLAGLEEVSEGVLVDLSGSTVSFEKADAFSEAYPNAEFAFLFSSTEIGLSGEEFTVRSNCKELNLSGITDLNMDVLRELLDRMICLEQLVMCDCGIPDEEMGALREEYPETKVVWRLYLQGGQYTLRTDAVAFSTLFGEEPNQGKLISESLEPLRYCTDLKALDLGHMLLTDISFLRYVPELRVLILADTQITDITPIGELQNLTYLEIFMNYYVESLEPLSHLPHLRDLNISYVLRARDYQYLYGLTELERLWANCCKLSPQEREDLRNNIVPTCELHVAEDESSTGGGWRDGSEKHLAQYNMFRGNYLDPIFEP